VRRPYAEGVYAKLTAQGFCKRCGLHATQMVGTRLNAHLHRCEVGDVSWDVEFPYVVKEDAK
jgi:transketolase N-terminal domain/subunit